MHHDEKTSFHIKMNASFQKYADERAAVFLYLNAGFQFRYGWKQASTSILIPLSISRQLRGLVWYVPGKFWRDWDDCFFFQKGPFWI